MERPYYSSDWNARGLLIGLERLRINHLNPPGMIIARFSRLSRDHVHAERNSLCLRDE
jgi:hypothetical protein